MQLLILKVRAIDLRTVVAYDYPNDLEHTHEANYLQAQHCSNVNTKQEPAEIIDLE